MPLCRVAYTCTFVLVCMHVCVRTYMHACVQLYELTCVCAYARKLNV